MVCPPQHIFFSISLLTFRVFGEECKHIQESLLPNFQFQLKNTESLLTRWLVGCACFAALIITGWMKNKCFYVFGSKASVPFNFCWICSLLIFYQITKYWNFFKPGDFEFYFYFFIFIFYFIVFWVFFYFSNGFITKVVMIYAYICGLAFANQNTKIDNTIYQILQMICIHVHMCTCLYVYMIIFVHMYIFMCVYILLKQ